MTSELIPRPITEAARHDWDANQVQAIRATVAKDCNNEELAMFLELAARYRLDPFAKEIWAAKMPGRDGGAGRVAIIVGRDGLLNIANRHADFAGVTADAVYEHDEYGKEETPEGPVVTHRSGKPAERGQLIGAFALVHRKGRRPTYFWASLDQYLPTSEKKLQYSPWGRQVDAMIIKVAMSNALRLAFNLSGLYGEDEMRATLHMAEEESGAVSGIEWGEDDLLAQHLGQLFAASNAAKPDSYTPAKIKLMLAGKTDGERQDIAAELEQFIRDHGGAVPEFPEVLEGEVVAEIGDDAQVSMDVA